MTSETSLPESISKSNSQLFQQKSSLLKSNNLAKNYIVQLPRFLSQEKKPQKLKLTFSNKFATQTKHVTDHNTKNNRKLSKLTLKCLKTQKNQTPTKVRFDGKHVKMQGQKLKELLSKGRPMEGTKMKMLKKQPQQTTQVYQMKPKYADQLQTKKQDSSLNQNRINYKSTKSKKKERILINFVQTEEAYSQTSEIKSSREGKLATQQAPLSKIKETLSKGSLLNKNLFEDFMKISKQQIKNNNGHQRIFSLLNKPVLKSGKIQRQHIEHIQLVQEVIKKIINQPNNLDFPQVYIVTDKAKYQKTIYNFLQQKQRKDYKNFIIYCRMTFYLCAHFILLSINAKVLVGILSKLLQIQITLLKIFGVQNDKSREKFLSQSKMVHNQGSTKKEKQQNFLFIQSRNKNIGRNNQIIKNMIEGILNNKNFPYFELFISLMESSTQIQSFQFIAFLDKTLKWQVLKMPTYPFLPSPQTIHKHYLILDLDETLIHFDSQQDLFHIRPYAQIFLKKLSAYFEITIFTAATKEYADEIINQIDREGHVKHRLYRNHLTYLAGQPIKDVSLLGRNIKTTIIIDNLQSNFRLQMDNGIQIKAWFGKGYDNVLQKVEMILLKIANEFPDDLRKGLKQYKSFIERQITQKSNLRPIFRM